MKHLELNSKGYIAALTNQSKETKLNFPFFTFCLAAPRPALGYDRGDGLTHLILITAFLQF